jgi:hypothetical protein
VYGENADCWAAATSVRTAVRLSLKPIVQPVSSLSLSLSLSRHEFLPAHLLDLLAFFWCDFVD